MIRLRINDFRPLRLQGFKISVRSDQVVNRHSAPSIKNCRFRASRELPDNLDGDCWRGVDLQCGSAGSGMRSSPLEVKTPNKNLCPLRGTAAILRIHRLPKWLI